MNRQSRARWLIVGVGNTYRRDDGVGPYVARLLMGRTRPDFAVIEQSGEATALIQACGEADEVIVVDAIRGGAPPGTVHQFDVRRASLAREWFRGSSHCLGIVQAIDILRSLGRLPGHVLVYGVEGESFGWGIGLSQRVERAARELAENIIPDLMRHAHRGGV
jgi:hydrogenase maturation protease